MSVHPARWVRPGRHVSDDTRAIIFGIAGGLLALCTAVGAITLLRMAAS